MTAKDETTVFIPKWNADGLMPVVAVDVHSKEILMLAYANEEALKLTLETGEAHYWSRSRQSLWHKGATSGAIQKIIHVDIDCDQDSLIYTVESNGPACHTGRPTCYYRRLELNTDGEPELRHLGESLAKA